jgi:hypothetical protein
LCLSGLFTVISLLLLELVLIMKQEVDDVGDDLRLLLVFEVLKVLVNPGNLKVIREELVVANLPQLPQYLLLVIANLVHVEGRLPPGITATRLALAPNWSAASGVERRLDVVLNRFLVNQVVACVHSQIIVH